MHTHVTPARTHALPKIVTVHKAPPHRSETLQVRSHAPTSIVSMQTARIKQEARAALAEFLACVFFVFFGAGSVVGAVSATSDAGPVEPVNYALSFGFSITILAFSIGDLSGAHINPAVTLSLALSRNLTLTRAFMYIAAQIAGGIVGGGFLFMCVDHDSYHSGIGLASDITPAGE